MLRQISDGTTLLEFFRQLREGARHVFAEELDVTAAATTAVQSFQHPLTGAYHGVEVLYQSVPVAFYALPPRNDRRVYYQLGAATAVTLRVRVY